MTIGTVSLNHLAHLYGVQTAYYDIARHRQMAAPEPLMAVLRALGATVSSLEDVPAALRECQQAQWQRCLEPVIVAWDGEPPPVTVRLPVHLADTHLNGYVKLESGEQIRLEFKDRPTTEAVDIEGTRYVA